MSELDKLPAWKKDIIALITVPGNEPFKSYHYYPSLMDDLAVWYEAHGIPNPYEWIRLIQNVVPKTVIGVYLAKINGTQFWSDADLDILVGTPLDLTVRDYIHLVASKYNIIGKMTELDTSVLVKLPQRKKDMGGIKIPAATEDWLSDRCGRVIGWGENAFRYIRNYPFGPTIRPDDIIAIRPQDILRFDVGHQKFGTIMDSRALVKFNDEQMIKDEEVFLTYDI